jgi:hypothetical protein
MPTNKSNRQKFFVSCGRRLRSAFFQKRTAFREHFFLKKEANTFYPLRGCWLIVPLLCCLAPPASAARPQTWLQCSGTDTQNNNAPGKWVYVISGDKKILYEYKDSALTELARIQASKASGEMNFKTTAYDNFDVVAHVYNINRKNLEFGTSVVRNRNDGSITPQSTVKGACQIIKPQPVTGNKF